MQEACRRAQTYLIVYLYLKLSLIISNTHVPVSVCGASTVLPVQCTCNFGDKLKFTEVVLFQNFLLTRITTGRADCQNKKGQCRVKKSKTTLVLEILSLHRRRACYKWRNNCGFYRSKKISFHSEISPDITNDLGKL